MIDAALDFTIAFDTLDHEDEQRMTLAAAAHVALAAASHDPKWAIAALTRLDRRVIEHGGDVALEELYTDACRLIDLFPAARS